MITRDECRKKLEEIQEQISLLLQSPHNIHDIKEFCLIQSQKLNMLQFDLGILFFEELSKGIQRNKDC